MLNALALLGSIVINSDPLPFSVALDASRREVLLRLGPVDLPSIAGYADHAAMYDAGGHDLAVPAFAWPASGWARGVRITLRDGSGRVLSNRMLHHLNVVNLGRRQLLQPVFERIIALGQETEAILLPKSVGVRLERGDSIAVHLAFINESPDDLHGVMLEVTIPYLPAATMPRPVHVRPIVLDVGFRAGLPNVFDLPPGTSVHEREFVLPTPGRLLGVGGHLHRFARSLTLMDARTGKVLVRLTPSSDTSGEVTRVSRKLFGISGDGLRLEEGRRYRVRAVYQNPGDKVLVNGGMAVMVGVFAPADQAPWPVLDRDDPAYQADLAMLLRKRVAPDSAGKGTAHPH